VDFHLERAHRKGFVVLHRNQRACERALHCTNRGNTSNVGKDENGCIVLPIFEPIRTSGMLVPDSSLSLASATIILLWEKFPMSRKLVWLFSSAVLALLCAITSSCGGSSSSGGGNGGPFDVKGNWQASFSPDFGNTGSASGVISSSGLGAFFDGSGDIVQLPTVTGASSFSGNLTTYAVNGTFFSGGGVTLTDTAQGSVNSASSITGSFTGTPSGTFSLAPFSPSGGTVVPITGAMNGRITGFVDALTFNFSSNGSFTGVDGSNPGCNVNGTLTQEGTSNVFDVTYNLGPGNCFSATLTGVAFESKTDYFNVNGGVDSTYLYMIMLTSTLQQIRPYVVIVYQ
jgi:hypothetical protein